MTGTVAITGATGFIGREVARHLAAAGWKLRLLARTPGAAAALGLPDATIVPGRLEDADSLRALVSDADGIVHAAGLVKARNRRTFFTANAEGTRNLLLAAADSGTARQIVLLSSLAAREPQLSAYAASKRASEEVAELAAKHPSWSILRPPAVYGPGDREILPFFRAVAAGFGAMPGGPDARLSLIHVADVATAVEALLRRPAPGRTFEIHDGHAGGYSWPELVAAAGAAVGTRPMRLRLPRLALRLAGLTAQGGAALAFRPAMLTPGKVREMLHPDWVVRDSSLTESTGWRPQMDLAAGFRQTVEWYRREGWLAVPRRRSAPRGV